MCNWQKREREPYSLLCVCVCVLFMLICFVFLDSLILSISVSHTNFEYMYNIHRTIMNTMFCGSTMLTLSLTCSSYARRSIPECIRSTSFSFALAFVATVAVQLLYVIRIPLWVAIIIFACELVYLLAASSFCSFVLLSAAFRSVQFHRSSRFPNTNVSFSSFFSFYYTLIDDFYFTCLSLAGLDTAHCFLVLVVLMILLFCKRLFILCLKLYSAYTYMLHLSTLCFFLVSFPLSVYRALRFFVSLDSVLRFFFLLYSFLLLLLLFSFCTVQIPISSVCQWFSVFNGITVYSSHRPYIRSCSLFVVVITVFIFVFFVLRCVSQSDCVRAFACVCVRHLSWFSAVYCRSQAFVILPNRYLLVQKNTETNAYTHNHHSTIHAITNVTSLRA